MQLLTKKNKLSKILFVIVFTFILTFTIEVITRNGLWYGWNFLIHHFKKYLFNSLIVFLTLTPTFLFKRRTFFISLISLVWIIFSIADNFIIKFRGTPLTGADLLMIKDGATLAKQYLSSNLIIILVILLLIVIIGLIFTFIKCKKTKVNYKITLPIVLIFILFFPNITNYALKKNIVSTNFWDITNMYSEYGFPFSFLNSVFNTGLDKPKDYSKELVNTLKAKLLTTDNSTTKLKPNIIFVQLESFIDPNYINDISFNMNPIPNFTKLKSSFPCGLLTVPSLGGGTANTEFEILTSMTTDFFGVGEFPYNTILTNATVNSSGYLFKSLDYDTHSLHNHEATFYNRYKVYGNLGFDSFSSIETMPDFERTVTGWAKDKILTGEIMDCLKTSDNPDFIYAISVQGHGPYPNTPIENSKIEITKTYDNLNKNSFMYYANIISEMDSFVAKLISDVNSLNEPSLIIFFGDHFPGLGIPSDKLNTGSLYTTDYVIWNNLNLPNNKKNLETYQLMSYVLNLVNLSVAPINSLHINYANSDNYMNDLYLLEYDILYGKNYINNEKHNVPLPNYRIGRNLPEVHSISITDVDAIILGANYNIFSKAFVNNNELATTYIDSSRLCISLQEIKTGDTISIKQLSPNGTVLSSSSNYVYK